MAVDYVGLYEVGAAPVLVFPSGGAPVATVSLNGSPFVATTNAPVPMVGVYNSLQMTSAELASPGTLIVKITSAGPDVVLMIQIRQLLNEIVQRVRTIVVNQLRDQLVTKINESTDSLATTVKNVVTTQLAQRNKST